MGALAILGRQDLLVQPGAEDLRQLVATRHECVGGSAGGLQVSGREGIAQVQIASQVLHEYTYPVVQVSVNSSESSDNRSNNSSGRGRASDRPPAAALQCQRSKA